MASPQTENGYTKIANEILERLALPGITGSDYRILLFVLRKTYGFHKNQDKISLTQFQKGTLMQRRNVVRTIQSLVAKRILLKEGNSYKFNKNWEEWGGAKRTLGGQTDTRVGVKRIPKVGVKRTHTKETKKELKKRGIFADAQSPSLEETREQGPKDSESQLTFEQWLAENYSEVEKYGGEEVGVIIMYVKNGTKTPVGEEEARRRYQAHLKHLSSSDKARRPLKEMSSVWLKFSDRCKQDLDKTPAPSAAGRDRMAIAIKKIGYPQTMEMIDWWFDQNLQPDITIHIHKALSDFQINNYIASL